MTAKAVLQFLDDVPAGIAKVRVHHSLRHIAAHAVLVGSLVVCALQGLTHISIHATELW